MPTPHCIVCLNPGRLTLPSRDASVQQLPGRGSVQMPDARIFDERRLEVARIDADGRPGARFSMGVVCHATALAAAVVVADAAIPGVSDETVLRGPDSNRRGFVVGPERPVAAADGAVAARQRAR